MFRTEKKKKEPFLQICRYTDTIWKQMFPERPMDIWQNETRPYSFRDYMQFLVHGLGEHLNYDVNAIEKILVTPVDEEYLYFLKDNGIEPTPENMQENVQYYVQDIDGANSLRLLRKNNMDISITPMCLSLHVLLPNGCHNGRTEFRPGENTVRLVKEYMDAVYLTDTYVLPYYILAHKITEEEARLSDIAMAHFVYGKTVSYGMYETQYLDDARVNFVGMCIPFFLFDRTQTAEVDMNSPEYRKTGALDFSGIDRNIIFADRNDKKVPRGANAVGSLKGTPLEAAIQSDFPDCRTDITIQPLMVSQARNFELDILRMTEKALERIRR